MSERVVPSQFKRVAKAVTQRVVELLGANVFVISLSPAPILLWLECRFIPQCRCLRFTFPFISTGRAAK